MAITKPGAIATALATEVRSNVAAAESATINDVNFPPANLVDTAGSKSVLIYPRFLAGTNPTVTIEPLVRMGDTWVKLSMTSALGEGEAAIVETFGRKVYFRAEGITGAPTNFDLFCAAFEPFKYDGPSIG